MEELIKLISETGVLILIAVAFIWDKITYAKTTDGMLREVQEKVRSQEAAIASARHSLEMLSSTLALIQNIIQENRQMLVNHDRRAEDIYGLQKAMQATLSALPGLPGGKND
jgi:hypothetical protein